jgi:hypothetical protein
MACYAIWGRISPPNDPKACRNHNTSAKTARKQGTRFIDSQDIKDDPTPRGSVIGNGRYSLMCVLGGIFPSK